MFQPGPIAAAAEGPGAVSAPPDAPARAMFRPVETAGEIAAEWAALAAVAVEPNPFTEYWFAAAGLAHFGRFCDLRLVEVRRGARLIGVMVLSIERGYARLPLRHVQNWWHHQMFLDAPLVEAGQESAFWRAVLAALDEAQWAPNFLHIRGIPEDGPLHRALAEVRAAPIVHRRVRAFLDSDLPPDAYFEQAVRGKKRKELRRQKNRLAELGALGFRILGEEAELKPWCDAYLALEQAGWKGKAGTALACDPHAEAFFRDVVAAAFAAGRLQFRRLDVGGRPVAMLVNFLTPPGSYSFKTVFDEDYARFSPGVLLQIENLDILERPDIAWMDSCAIEDHPMIDGLWTERRSIVRVTVPLKGARRAAAYALVRALERVAALRKRRR
jgi:CelD/BcsL family acetyltransferase involved in cellulose biosynthesis